MVGKVSSLKIIIFSMTLVFVCCGSMAAELSPQMDKDIASQLKEVDEFIQKGEYSRSLVLARQLKAKCGDHPLFGWQLDGRLGLASLLLGDYAGSVQYLEAAIGRRPEESAFHRNLGSALVGLGYRGRALSEFSQAVELDPENFYCQLELGQLLFEFKNYRQARLHLELAHHLCGGCEEATQALAHLYLLSGNPGLAMTLFQELLENNPSPTSRRNLVQSMQQAGEDSVLVTFLGAWPADQLQADELHLLINAERRCGQYFHARSYLHKRLDLSASHNFPGVYASHKFWGEVAYSLLLAEQLEDALLGFELALELDPENHAYQNNREVVLGKISDRESK